MNRLTFVQPEDHKDKSYGEVVYRSANGKTAINLVFIGRQKWYNAKWVYDRARAELENFGEAACEEYLNYQKQHQKGLK